MFQLRLLLDLLAAGLLVVGLAYYWLDNLSHELIGTAMFALIILHNVFNRRWYGAASRTQRGVQGGINILSIVTLAIAMVALLVTSLMISQSLFGFLPLNGGYTARQIHTLAAYWAVIVVSVHVGLRWSMIMGVVRNLCGITSKSRVRAVFLRLLAFAISAYGIHSANVIGLGAKLTATVTMDYWDFTVSILPFFVHMASIMGMLIFISHHFALLLRYLKQRSQQLSAKPKMSSEIDVPNQKVDFKPRSGYERDDITAGQKR